PASGLAARVDSDAARRLLADVLARRMAEARLPVAAGSSRLTDVASSELQPGGAGDDLRLPDQAFLKKLADRTSMDFAALIFARALTLDSRSHRASDVRPLPSGRTGPLGRCAATAGRLSLHGSLRAVVAL